MKSAGNTPASASIAGVAEAGISYRVRSNAGADSLEEVARAYGVPVERMAKSMVIHISDEQHAMVLLPINRSIAWKELRHLLAENRLTMAKQAEAEELTGFVRGTINPFGTKTPMQVVMDQHLLTGSISTGAGVPGYGLVVSGREVADYFAALIGDISRPSAPR